MWNWNEKKNKEDNVQSRTWRPWSIRIGFVFKAIQSKKKKELNMYYVYMRSKKARERQRDSNREWKCQTGRDRNDRRVYAQKDANKKKKKEKKERQTKGSQLRLTYFKHSTNNAQQFSIVAHGSSLVSIFVHMCRMSKLLSESFYVLFLFLLANWDVADPVTRISIHIVYTVYNVMYYRTKKSKRRTKNLSIHRRRRFFYFIFFFCTLALIYSKCVRLQYIKSIIYLPS